MGARFVNLFNRKTKPISPATLMSPDSGTHFPDTILPGGSAAPDFSLVSTSGKVIGLADLRAKPVILVFYPADWSPVCGDQLALYNEVLPMFNE